MAPTELNVDYLNPLRPPPPLREPPELPPELWELLEKLDDEEV